MCFKHHGVVVCIALHLFMYLPRREGDTFSSSPDPCIEPSVRNLVRAQQAWMSEYICTKRFLKCDNKLLKLVKGTSDLKLTKECCGTSKYILIWPRKKGCHNRRVVTSTKF